MANNQLRLFPAVDEPVPTQPATVPMTIRDLLPILAQAHLKRSSWLRDFLDDEVLVTRDLYEVLEAYQAMRPSA